MEKQNKTKQNKQKKLKQTETWLNNKFFICINTDFNSMIQKIAHILSSEKYGTQNLVCTNGSDGIE